MRSRKPLPHKAGCFGVPYFLQWTEYPGKLIEIYRKHSLTLKLQHRLPLALSTVEKTGTVERENGVSAKKTWIIRTFLLASGMLVFILLLLGLASFFIDEPLREYIESNLNENLEGYTVQLLEAVDFHPIGFSIDFENLTLRQEANPDPPLLVIQSWTASIQWTALLKLEIVSDHLINHASIFLRSPQAEQEVKDNTDVGDKGWQQALYALYPVTINTFQVKDSSFSYLDQADHPPLELLNLQLRVENIQNIRSPEGEYPSTVHMEGSIHPSGRLSLSGTANFLAKPFPGISLDFDMQNIELQPFIPVSSLLNVSLRSGTVNGRGHVEYAPWTNSAHIATLEVDHPHIDFVVRKSQGKSPQSEKPASLPQERNNSKSKDPFKVLVDSASVKNGQFGYINQTTEPPYKIFINDVDLQVSGVGSPTITQKGELRLSGKFMGKGKPSIEGGFRPEVEHPDFDIKMKIEKTDMTALNDAFKAYGGFDVKSGNFSLYSELHAHKGNVKGYIKPFFDKSEIFDLSQDKTDNIFQQVYESVAGAVASILGNVPRDQVATKTEITGKMENIEVGTWELLWNLLRNAFVDAMTPAFENLKTMGTNK